MSTNDKIKELTDKIYLEGIEKAKQEADLILENARKEAEEIVNSAKKKEAEIAAQIQKQAEELKKNTESELKLAARQFTSTLKQQISNEIVSAQVEEPVEEAFKNKEFIQKMILSIVEKWDPKSSDGMNISLLLPEKEEKEINNYFNGKAKELLNSGLEISFLPTIKNGFKIAPKDSSYQINFTDEGFENYFKHYIKDKTKKLIFDN